MKSRLVLLAFALSVGLASCDADRGASPDTDSGLALEASISDASIGPGQTATVTYGVRNAGSTPLTIAADCGRMLPYIKDERAAIVHPAGGAWICPAIVRPPVTLAPGEAVTRTRQVAGGSALEHRGTTLVLPPGRYTAYVELMVGVTDTGDPILLRSRDATFEVEGT